MDWLSEILEAVGLGMENAAGGESTWKQIFILAILFLLVLGVVALFYYL